MPCYGHKVETCADGRPICKKCWPLMLLNETESVKTQYNIARVEAAEQPLCALVGCWNVVRQEGEARDVGECHKCYRAKLDNEEARIPAAKRQNARDDCPRPDLLRSSAMSPRHAISPPHQQLIDVVARTANNLRVIADNLEAAAAAADPRYQ